MRRGQRLIRLIETEVSVAVFAVAFERSWRAGSLTACRPHL